MNVKRMTLEQLKEVRSELEDKIESLEGKVDKINCEISAINHLLTARSQLEKLLENNIESRDEIDAVVKRVFADNKWDDTWGMLPLYAYKERVLKLILEAVTNWSKS